MNLGRCSALALGLASTALASGCAHRHLHSHLFGSRHDAFADAAFVAAAVVVGAAAAASASDDDSDSDERREPTVIQNIYVNGYPVPPAPQSQPLPRSPRDTVPSENPVPPFDAVRARSSLAAVELSSCRAAGAPRGHGHAIVTFNPAGNISKVVIDVPASLPPAAVECIGERLGEVAVPVFRGSLINVGTSWFVP